MKSQLIFNPNKYYNKIVMIIVMIIIIVEVVISRKSKFSNLFILPSGMENETAYRELRETGLWGLFSKAPVT